MLLQVAWDFRQLRTQLTEEQTVLVLCTNSGMHSEDEYKIESSEEVLALGILQGHWWLCDPFFKFINHQLNVCLTGCTTLDMSGDAPKEEVGKGESCLKPGIVIYLL